MRERLGRIAGRLRSLAPSRAGLRSLADRATDALLTRDGLRKLPRRVGRGLRRGVVGSVDGVGRALSRTASGPAKLYAGLYLAAIPLFAGLYTTIPTAFYHANILLEAETAALERQLTDAIETVLVNTAATPEERADIALVGMRLSYAGDGVFRAETAGVAYSVTSDLRGPLIVAAGPEDRIVVRGKVEQAAFRALAARHEGRDSGTAGTFWRMLYLSAVTITTLGYGDIAPIAGISRALVGFQSVLGIVLMGLFLNALSRDRH